MKNLKAAFVMGLLIFAGSVIAFHRTPAQTSAPQAATSIFRSAATTSAATVKSSAGNLYGWYIYNPNASMCSADIFNATSGNVTLGVTTPILSLAIPATSAANLGPSPVAWGNFSTAISVAAVTAAGGASTCGTGMVVNLSYQ